MHQNSYTGIWDFKNFPGGETPGPPLQRAAASNAARGGARLTREGGRREGGGRREWGGREGIGGDGGIKGGEERGEKGEVLGFEVLRVLPVKFGNYR